jgi:hypothetical protein
VSHAVLTVSAFISRRAPKKTPKKDESTWHERRGAGLGQRRHTLNALLTSTIQVLVAAMSAPESNTHNNNNAVDAQLPSPALQEVPPPSDNNNVQAAQQVGVIEREEVPAPPAADPAPMEVSNSKRSCTSRQRSCSEHPSADPFIVFRFVAPLCVCVSRRSILRALGPHRKRPSLCLSADRPRHHPTPPSG